MSYKKIVKFIGTADRFISLMTNCMTFISFKFGFFDSLFYSYFLHKNLSLWTIKIKLTKNCEKNMKTYLNLFPGVVHLPKLFINNSKKKIKTKCDFVVYAYHTTIL